MTADYNDLHRDRRAVDEMLAEFENSAMEKIAEAFRAGQKKALHDMKMEISELVRNDQVANSDSVMISKIITEKLEDLDE